MREGRPAAAAAAAAESPQRLSPAPSAGQPQLTVIHGPWPPQPPSPAPSLPQPIAAPRALARRGSLGARGSGGLQLPSAFQAQLQAAQFQAQAAQQQAAQQQEAHSGGGSQHQQYAWRQLDDGSWMMPGGEVEWELGLTPAVANHAAADTGAALLSSPLVSAASYSPPLSPISAQLLLPARQPSAGLQRGPQRAPSLGLAPLERLPSSLSPERQLSRELQPSPRQLSSALYHELQPSPRQLSPSMLARRQSMAAADSASGSGAQPAEPPPPLWLGASGGSGSGALPSEPPPPLLPVQHASPDVAPSGAVPAPTSPFRASPVLSRSGRASPALARGSGGSAGAGAAAAAAAAGAGYGSLGGLPVEAVEALEKRGHRRRAESAEEAHAAADSRALRAPLLAQPLLAESEGAAEEGLGAAVAAGIAGASVGSGGSGGLAASFALLAAPLLGAGLLAAPRALALTGLVAGGAGLLGAALLSLLSTHLLAQLSRSLSAAGSYYSAVVREPAVVRYADVARRALGSAGAVLTDAAVAVNSFGLMSAAFIVLGDVLVGTEDSEGLLGEWAGDRPTALAVVGVVVLAPLLCFRHSAGPVGSSALAAAAAAMGATTVVALALLAATQHASQPLQAWPNWDLLGRGGWAARAVQLTAAAGLLLLPALCQPALHSVMAVCPPRSRAPSRPRAASSLALLFSCSLAALLAVSCCALFGSAVQADPLAAFTPDALASLAGAEAGAACFLLIRLAFAVALLGSFPLLMEPFRDSLWRCLFWQPLLPGAGHVLVTLAALAGALWSSLNASLWGLLSVLAATTAPLLALLVPGLAACVLGRGWQRAGGALLATAGTACLAAGTAGLAAFPTPQD